MIDMSDLDNFSRFVSQNNKESNGFKNLWIGTTFRLFVPPRYGRYKVQKGTKS